MRYVSIFGGIILFSLMILLTGCSGKGGEPIFEEEKEIVVNIEEDPFPQKLVAEVKGQVLRPGVYTLPEGSRLYELVALAGGTTSVAELRQVNLALRVLDGDSFYIPAVGEEPLLPAPSTEGKSGSPAPMDLNRASKEDLMKVPGIGPATADNILKYREEKGRFSSVEELLEVPRIGEKTLEKIREYFIVR